MPAGSPDPPGFGPPQVAWAGLTLGSQTASAAVPNRLAQATIKVAMNLAADKVITAGMVPASIVQLVPKGKSEIYDLHETDGDCGGCRGDPGIVTTGRLSCWRRAGGRVRSWGRGRLHTAGGGPPAPLVQESTAPRHGCRRRR